MEVGVFRLRLAKGFVVDDGVGVGVETFVGFQEHGTRLAVLDAENASRFVGHSHMERHSDAMVAALRTTLQVVTDRFTGLLRDAAEEQDARRQRLRTLRDYRRKVERFGALSHEEEQELQQLEAEDLAQWLADQERASRRGARQVARTASTVESLESLLALAEAAADEDPKLAALVAQIQTIRGAEPGANVLVYTEYTTSQRALVEALEAAKVRTVLTMSGEDDDRARTETSERFRTEQGLVLVSTDAAAEGLNLQQRCHHLIHLELPFNPNRLEQRNGRIDRYGQKHEPIVRYLFLRGSFEERILLRLIAKYERQRATLTFVPNTLGVTTSTDAAAERLLKGLMDEDTKRFETEGTLFDFEQEDENEGADDATRDLLEEIDRSLRGYREAARSNEWLGDAGLNAEKRLLAEAGEAREEGQRAGAVDLARFVCDAAMLDGGDTTGDIADEVFSVALPPAWRGMLEDLPGYDGSARSVRLTTRIDVMSDADGNPVGLVGRGHPLVRRAIDRVRNLSHGGSAQSQDPRVSAVAADVPAPALLYTFLGRVVSQAGRELERVFAVQVASGGEAQVYESADAWLQLADPPRAIRTTDAWKNHFEAWAAGAEGDAKAAAEATFAETAAAFVADRQAALDAERTDHGQWLRVRADHVTEIDRSERAQMRLDMDDADDSTEAQRRDAPAWAGIADPAERLAAFAADRSQPPNKRAEADGVLRLHRQRLDELDAHAAIGEPEVTPLGVLMLVPEGHHV